MIDLTTFPSAGHYGLTAATAQSGHEAASACLSHVNSLPPKGANLTAFGQSKIVPLKWTVATPQVVAANADLQDATEAGAVTIALCAVEFETGLKVIERSFKGTGFDYWLGQGDEPPFSNLQGIEISGILKSSDPTVLKARLTQKKNQIAASVKLGKPVFVAVVEFSTPKIVLER